jgi:hypothetical protein
MVNNMRRKSRRRFIETYEFPKALHVKLHEELGDSRTADIALDGLRGWYLAYLYADGRLIGMPSKAVDEAWHEMILMTREYTWFCQQAFGHYLHHSPESTLDVSMDELLAETIALVDKHDLPMVLFTADTDARLEHGTHWHSSDLHRLRILAKAAEDRRRRERRRSSGGSSSSDAAWGGFFSFGGGDGGSGDGGGSGVGGGGSSGAGCWEGG